ncbi:OsmC family protein [Alkalicoccus urumqiensis]|uniref:Osmotically inducible protein C n=1 Tax=Alkalicoccus urumqiensis TaxID=1548213 RepID=A0A2P6MGM2_ALKUR|nr:OsmC family protein [Alkalicoccus urumqiensis]PRO65432.1 osmotically inducible protein C [Alkalicoccus urumqiensis]
MEFKWNQDHFTGETEFGEMVVSGDETKGFRPYQMMVGSIAVCSASVLRQVMEKQRLEVTGLTVKADVKRNPDEANRITHIALHYVIQGGELPETKVERAVKLASANCPMARTVEGAVEITETFELNS